MRRAPLVLSILALVLAATGVAVSAPKGADGVIHACFDQRQVDGPGGGEVVLINAGQTCSAATGGDFPDALTWNATGPAGPVGPVGQSGPAGPTGPQGTPAPVEKLPPTEVKKVDSAEKKLETAQDKIDAAIEKLKGSKDAATPAELTKFMQSVQAMVTAMVGAQQVSLTLLRSLPPGAARDLAIRQAEEQIARAQQLLPRIQQMLRDKKLTSAELQKLLQQLPQLLSALMNSQSAMNDGLAGRKPDPIGPAKKP